MNAVLSTLRGMNRSSSTLEERQQARLAILKIVAQIPRGTVFAYGQVAWAAGLPGRARMVGRILAETPATADIPWHRVINAQGSISLPKSSPSYVEQRRRLRAEGIVFNGDRISLRRYGWRRGGEAPVLD